MKFAVFSLIVLAVLLVACTTTQEVIIPQEPEPAPEPVAAPMPVPGAQVEETVVEPSPEPAAEPKPKSKEQKEIEEILGNYEEHVKSYQYVYRDPRDDHSIRLPFAGAFSVKEPRVKIVLLAPDAEISARLANIGSSDQVVYRKQLYDQDYFDVVYLNTAKERAIGHCVSQLCKERWKQVPLTYSFYKRKLPHEWAAAVDPAEAKIVEDKTIMSKQIAKIEYPGEEGTVRLWIEHFSGLPIQVDYVKGGREYSIMFEQLAINQVRDSDFEVEI